MSDLARWDLRGPVRTLRTEFAEWNPETGEWCALKNRFVATFRADGQLSEIEHYNQDGSVPREVEDHTFSLATYAYDEKGHRIETVRRMGTLSEERVTVRYDDFDNPVVEVRSDVSREMRIDDRLVKTEERPSHVQHVRFEYQYDAQGNWIERVASQRMEPNADERPSNIERRTITYSTE